MRRGLAVILGLALLALAGCGGYPEPFAGKPGRMGARLSTPPPPRLVVVPPTEALLTTADATAFAAVLANALADREVPAVTDPGRGPNWRLLISADMAQQAGGPMVTPSYTIVNPKGIRQGSTNGPPVSAETWSKAAPVALKLVATRDAPAIAALLDSIKAAVQLSDPNSLVNRPPRIVFTGVTGAPGDGDDSLVKAMNAALSNLGIVVQNSKDGADYQLNGTVAATPTTPTHSRVEIHWIMRDPYGAAAGDVAQINDVPTDAINRYWADTATAVAQDAAQGIKQVMINQQPGHHIDADGAR